MEALADQLPADGTSKSLHRTLGRIFQVVGMMDQAIKCFLKAGEPKAAVDVCIRFNQWDQALHLARELESGAMLLSEVQNLFSQRIAQCFSNGNKLHAVSLYRRANKSIEAATLLAELANDAGTKGYVVRAKKLYVLAALEVERFRARNLDLSLVSSSSTASTVPRGAILLGTESKIGASTSSNNSGDTTRSARGSLVGRAKVTPSSSQLLLTTLDNMLSTDIEGTSSSTATSTPHSSSSKVMDNAWRGAAAYHYYILSWRQYYRGNIEASLKTSIRCCASEYDGLLNKTDVYSLVALTSYLSGQHDVCSFALFLLETSLSENKEHGKELEEIRNMVRRNDVLLAMK